MDFGGALQYLKDGKRVARTGWNGKGMWLKLQVPDAHSKMQRPYIYMSPADGLLVPWLASQTDMLADDWCVLGETYKVAGDTHDMTGTLGGLPQAPGPRAEDYSEKEKPRADASATEDAAGTLGGAPPANATIFRRVMVPKRGGGWEERNYPVGAPLPLGAFDPTLCHYCQERAAEGPFPGGPCRKCKKERGIYWEGPLLPFAPETFDAPDAPAAEDAEEIADKNVDILPTNMPPRGAVRLELVGGRDVWYDIQGNIILETDAPIV